MFGQQLFPTMVIGSLPRPRWVIDLVDGREAGHVSEEDFQKAVDPAVEFGIALQQAAGVDVISDGEWRRRTYFTGFARAVEGFAPDVIEVGLLDGGTKRWPGVVEKLRYRDSIAAHEIQFLKDHTAHPVKATLPSPYMVDRWFYDPDYSGASYPHRRDLIQDAADILRQEVLVLRDIGVDIIQFDDAMIGRYVGEEYNSMSTNPKVKITMADRDAELEMAIWRLNRVVEGIENVTTALHVCRGHRARMHAAHGGFEPILPYAYQAQVNILALELAAPDAGSIESLKTFPEDKMLGLGAIDILSDQVAEPAVIADRAKQALRFVDASRLILNPDCGFAPAHDNPISLDEAYLKLKALSTAAGELRAEQKSED